MTTNKDKPALLEYQLDTAVQAFSTMRHGGVSTGNYASLNVNPFSGDNPSHVSRNRQMLAETIGISEDRIILPHQTHSTNVLCIDDNLPSAQQLEDVDAVITNQENLCIGVSTADCIPILLYDPVTGTIAAIHAGWRGTVGHIVTRVTEVMKDNFAVDPANLKAVIGPGISLDAFEVGDEVYDAFAKANFNMDAIARRYLAGNGEKKWHINLPLANYLLLTEAGLNEQNILDVSICTYKAHEKFFSARRLGINSGRIYTAVMKRKSAM